MRAVPGARTLVPASHRHPASWALVDLLGSLVQVLQHLRELDPSLSLHQALPDEVRQAYHTTGRLVFPHEDECAPAPVAALAFYVSLALGVVLAGFFEGLPFGAVDSGARAALVTVEHLGAP